MAAKLAVVVAVAATGVAGDAARGPGAASGSQEQAFTLAQFFGEPSPAEIRSEEAALHNRMQRVLRDCMSAAGFEYQPLPYVPPEELPAGGIRGGVTPTFARTKGYGISTLIGRAPRTVEDPNHEILMNLDRMHRADYLEERRRCAERAYDRVFGPMVDAEAVLLPRYEEFKSDLLADWRMQLAMSAWSTCMRDQGFAFDSPASVKTYLRTRLRALVANGDALEGFDQRKLLKGLRQEEVALARADLQCQRAHVDQVERVVRAELEPRFVRENYDLLRTIRDAPERLPERKWPWALVMGASLLVLVAIRLAPRGGRRYDQSVRD